MYAVTRLDNYRSLKPVGLVRHPVFYDICQLPCPDQERVCPVRVNQYKTREFHFFHWASSPWKQYAYTENANQKYLFTFAQFLQICVAHHQPIMSFCHWSSIYLPFIKLFYFLITQHVCERHVYREV